MGQTTPTSPPEPEIALKHRRASRWFHWTNFPLLALMIWSGILIYWANDIYHIDAGDYRLKFFPRGWYTALGLDHRLAEGMAWHFFLQWFFVLNGVAYVAYTVFSGEWRQLVPRRGTFRDAWLVVLHDLHLRKTPPPQPQKYNGAQRILYTLIIFFGVFSTLTGYVMFKPVQLYWLRELLGGYETARFLHFWLAVGYVLFFVLHVVQVARAGWNNFRAMVSGYEVK
ncbi:MAG: cytochrome b/b6 domain-containing protein [Deltaproteobacteria bacterium]|nr:cytochrome b/b6 domain-containing protein [Deltaproteobacteria bacterium]